LSFAVANRVIAIVDIQTTGAMNIVMRIQMILTDFLGKLEFLQVIEVPAATTVLQDTVRVLCITTTITELVDATHMSRVLGFGMR